MPVSATASAIAAAEIFAASYLTCSRREALEAGDVFEAPLEHSHFFAAVHPFDLEGRLGVQFTDSAGH
ncbi:MAG: hypothetical protein DMF97_11020 [Acidobacteria bacterium]|nr:MAG: hypothetical protein DMF97_11020 [Acidobacteriota bacterium]